MISLQLHLCSVVTHEGLESGQKSLPLLQEKEVPEWRAGVSRQS